MARQTDTDRQQLKRRVAATTMTGASAWMRERAVYGEGRRLRCGGGGGAGGRDLCAGGASLWRWKRGQVAQAQRYNITGCFPLYFDEYVCATVLTMRGAVSECVRASVRVRVCTCVSGDDGRRGETVMRR